MRDPVQHTKPMLSIDPIWSVREARKFDSRVRQQLNITEVSYVAEPKFDGISVELVYQNGTFIQGSTRGDGEIGENITKNLLTIESIPEKLDDWPCPTNRLIAVRGEVLMAKASFEQLNRAEISRGNAPFISPRCAAGSSVRNLDINIAASRDLDFRAYEIMVYDHPVHSQLTALTYLSEWGFKTARGMPCRSIQEAIDWHLVLKEQPDEIEHAIDGTVIKVDSYDLQNRLGEGSRFPHWACAFKF